MTWSEWKRGHIWPRTHSSVASTWLYPAGGVGGRGGQGVVRARRGAQRALGICCSARCEAADAFGGACSGGTDGFPQTTRAERAKRWAGLAPQRWRVPLRCAAAAAPHAVRGGAVPGSTQHPPRTSLYSRAMSTSWPCSAARSSRLRMGCSSVLTAAGSASRRAVTCSGGIGARGGGAGGSGWRRRERRRRRRWWRSVFSLGGSLFGQLAAPHRVAPLGRELQSGRQPGGRGCEPFAHDNVHVRPQNVGWRPSDGDHGPMRAGDEQA